MLARRLPMSMPPLSLEENLETTKIHSIAGNRILYANYFDNHYLNYAISDIDGLADSMAGPRIPVFSLDIAWRE